MELQCEQISKELAQYRQLSEQECQALQKRLNEARNEGRAEAQKQKEDLAHTVNPLFFVLGNQMLFEKNLTFKSMFSKGECCITS